MIHVSHDFTELSNLLGDIAIQAKSAPDELQRRVKRLTTITRVKIRADLRAPENVPNLPFVWSLDPAKQARARRWYFANKVSKGSTSGRYQRTGALERGWDTPVVTNANGGEIQLVNNTPGAVYVQGAFQVPSHTLTGWTTDQDIVDKYRVQLADDISEEWYLVVTLP